MVIDYIDGKVYQEFDEMSSNEKECCIEVVEKIHSLNLLHDDVRAPNFIFGQNKVYLIDFGKSQIFPLNHNRVVFNRELNSLRNVLKLSS